MMKLLSALSHRLLLCVFFSLLWTATSSTTTVPATEAAATATASSPPTSTPTISSTIQITPTKPPPVEDVTVVDQNETSITLKWDKVNSISTYRLQYESENTTSKTDNIKPSDDSIVHVVKHLTAATTYNFSLTTQSVDGSSSDPYLFRNSTAPKNPKGVDAVEQTNNSITLRWTKEDNIDDYEITFSKMGTIVTEPVEAVTYTVTNLTSATRYSFTLYAVFENVRSSGEEYSAVTAPLNIEEVRTKGQTLDSITLEWNDEADINNYTVTFDDKVIDSTEKTFTITNLTSGTKYYFNLYAVFDTVRSSGVNHSAVTVPERVKDVIVSDQSETSITLEWEKVNDFTSYILQYDKNSVNISNTQTSVKHTVPNLTPGTKYDFTLIAVFEGVNSAEYTFINVTVPPMVQLITPSLRFPDSIKFEWTNINKDWKYIFEINHKNEIVTGSSDKAAYTAKGLEPGTAYKFTVITEFFGLNSKAYQDNTLTTIDCDTVNWHISNSSIQGTVKGLFTKAIATNGSETVEHFEGENVTFTGLYPGSTYNISLEYDKNSKILQQCNPPKELTTIPPYLNGRCEYWASGYSVRVAWTIPDGIVDAVEVNVNNKTETVNGDEDFAIIDGFQPAQTVKVSIRSRSEGPSSQVHSEPYNFDCYTDPRGVIGGSIAGVLIFAILVAVIVFIFIKRPDIIRKKSFIGKSKPPTIKAKPISAENFPNHFDQLNLDENRGFSLEYENLAPVGMDQTRSSALLPENKVKNRFTNILPYDNCRVKLSTSGPGETSDYINANYMPGYNNSKEYIATQGPLPSTINDFWRMIWEQRVKGIVMVTNCTEGGRTKCEKYWPTAGKADNYGNLLVTTRYEQQELNWTLREFSIKHKNSSEERTVKHFHFTAWPDHGVPQGTEVLIQFRELLRQHIEREAANMPTVVHCSAGVGRTGTIIALDVLLQQLQKKRAVGINDFVRKMRMNRPHMVQTESQYVFLHQCIMDSLQTNKNFDECVYENADMIYENATVLQEFR
ncbi:receptor-type tyrosine-protein phosphatase H-like isoform 2-T2 [Pholidichthys leucotaenia]